MCIRKNHRISMFQKERKMKMNIAIITGASSGMGQEFALQLDKQLSKVEEFWLVARRKDKMEELSQLLDHKTRIFPFDLSNESEIKQFGEVLEISKPRICMLINCAGFGLMGSFQELGLEAQNVMIDVNCKGLIQMTHFCIPYMRKNARIIQLASSAAFVPQENFSIYAATKSFVLSFSKSLGAELRKHKIYVTAVCPGPVDTAFFDIAEQYGKTLAVKKFTMVACERVVREAISASKQKKTMSVCSLPMQLFWIISKVIPHSFIMYIMRFLR